MKESYDERIANYIGLESCVPNREVVDEALTKVHIGQVLSRETDLLQVLTLYGKRKAILAESIGRDSVRTCAVIDLEHV